MELKFAYLLLFSILLDIAKSSGETSSCSKMDKAAILLDAANDFITRAQDSKTTFLFGSPHSDYTSYYLENTQHTNLLETATKLISAAKNTYSTKSHSDTKYKLICYFSSWALEREGEGRYDLSDFQPHLCTHAIYSIAKLENNRIESGVPEHDLPGYLNGYQKFNDLKKQNPNLKTLISIGGWSMGSAPFSFMAAHKSNRSIFIESVLVFLKQHGFDGLDMDWELPGANGGRPEDKNNFVILLKELKAALKPQGFLLTSTVSGKYYFIDVSYDIPAISKELDQMHLFSFDFHGKWDKVTGHQAPLYAPPSASYDDKRLTVDYAVDYWLKAGAPKEKLVLGLALFGRTFTLTKKSENGVGAPTSGAGQKGRLNSNSDILGFNEICENLLKNRWASVWDQYALTPYAFHEDQWVVYENQLSLKAKIDYLMKKRLAGALVWSIDTDDHTGSCYGQKYYLLQSIASKLLG